MESTACNYSIENTHDDGSCLYSDCAGECGGNAVLSGCDNACNSTKVNDCSGECGGNAVADACGTCEGSITAATQCACPVSGEVRDCAGECGGNAVEDCSGECGGNAVLSGCDNVCNSTKVNDCTGECGGDNSSCVSYSTEIQPIFTANCSVCHIASTRKNLSLSNYSSITSGNSINGPVIIAGDHTNSLLWQYINSGTMPPSGQLTSDQVNLIATWIDEGALNN